MKSDIYTSLISPHEPVTPLGQIQGAGFIHQKTSYLPWRVLGSYALVYILEGQGRYQDASGFAQEVRAGSLLLLFPEMAHRYGPGDNGCWSEFHVIFEGKPFDLWREAGILDARRPVWELCPVADWLSRLTAISAPLEPKSDTGSLVAVSCLLSILTEAAAAQHLGLTPPAALPWLNKARHLLGADLSRDRTAAEVAAELGLSHETFRKTFERHVGISPARFRADARLNAARALLLHTAMTSRQIADSLGFPDEFYFSRRFRQKFGISPRRYRLQTKLSAAD